MAVAVVVVAAAAAIRPSCGVVVAASANAEAEALDAAVDPDSRLLCCCWVEEAAVGVPM